LTPSSPTEGSEVAGAADEVGVAEAAAEFGTSVDAFGAADVPVAVEVFGAVVGRDVTVLDGLVLDLTVLGGLVLDALVLARLVFDGLVTDAGAADGLDDPPEVVPPTGPEHAATVAESTRSASDRCTLPGVGRVRARGLSSPPDVVITPGCQSRYPQVAHRRIPPAGMRSWQPRVRR
jgi:hypothetical protein